MEKTLRDEFDWAQYDLDQLNIHQEEADESKQWLLSLVEQIRNGQLIKHILNVTDHYERISKEYKFLLAEREKVKG